MHIKYDYVSCNFFLLFFCLRLSMNRLDDHVIKKKRLSVKMLMLTVSLFLSFAYCEGTRGTNLISCLCGFGAFIFY